MIMKAEKMTFLFSLIVLLMMMNCISTMETAKISRGMRYGAYFEYSNIKPRKFYKTTRDQNNNVVGLGLKISNGKYFGNFRTDAP